MPSMSTKIRIQDDFGRKQVILYEIRMPDAVARLATAFIERWGMVAGMPDGEDSAGRAKLRLSTTDEIVKRAFDIAEKFVAVADARGHMIDVPDLNEINAEHDKDRVGRDLGT